MQILCSEGKYLIILELPVSLLFQNKKLKHIYLYLIRLYVVSQFGSWNRKRTSRKTGRTQKRATYQR